MTVNGNQPRALKNVTRDLTAGLVVFFVALPLCLGIALASRAPGLADAANVPLFAGIIAGIIGGWWSDSSAVRTRASPVPRPA